jgi:hypothetical protein
MAKYIVPGLLRDNKCHVSEMTDKTRAVESESEGIFGGVGVGKNVPTPTSI